MLAVGYPVRGRLKNDSCEREEVTTVTEIGERIRQNNRAMARRSLAVVLIVALLGWTVNWPKLGCKGQHSRAAVLAPAGASPAYQPEPSPTRHNCCPHESLESPNAASSLLHECLLHVSAQPGCCSVSKEKESGLPPRVKAGTPFGGYALGSLTSLDLVVPEQAGKRAETFTGLRAIEIPSFFVLRL
jgi:hypothetical protein